jgi:uncharacterized protein (DUF433 family)
MNLPEFLIDHPDGEIRLAGHRIGLYSVVRSYQEGQSAEEIHETFPTLSVDLVRRVIAFYHQNQAEVDDYVRAYRAELDRQESAHPPGPGLLRLRQLLQEKRRTEAH